MECLLISIVGEKAHGSWLIAHGGSFQSHYLDKKIMAFRFEDLRVYQSAALLSNKIDLLTENFPKKEMYSLRSQIKRAADSVVLNIAEGSTGQSKPEFKRFLGIALRSGIEVVACLYLAFTRNYIIETDYRVLYEEYEVLCKMITVLRNSF